MPLPTAPHGDERQPSRLTQRAPGVPGDDPHPGYAGSRLLDDATDSALRRASMPAPPPGLEPGDASLALPAGAGFRGVGEDWQTGARMLGAGSGGERDRDRLDGPSGL